MNKKIIIIILTMVIMVGMMGCSGSESSDTTEASVVKSLRTATIASGWTVKQMELTVGSELSLVVTPLNNGEEVDGYFYIENGDDIGFQISGNTLIYESHPVDVKKGITSDRFSFIASPLQGTAYTLRFRSNATSLEKVTKQTIFLEIIYPSTSNIYEPSGAK